MRIIFDHVVESGHFVSQEEVSSSVELLACLRVRYVQCETIVPLRLKVCKSCQHVFRAKRKAEHNLPDKAMKRMRVLQSDSVKAAMKAKISCRRPVKEHQKLASKLCIDNSRIESTWQA